MGTQEGSGAGYTVTTRELERERIVTYLDWAQADVPGWWVPTYAVLVAAWVASHDLTVWWRVGASVAFVIAMGVLLWAITASTGVSMPRFRGMPSALKRTYLVPGIAAVLSLGAGILMAATMDDPSFTLLGVVVGPVLGLTLAWQGRRCRVVADEIAAEEGILR